MSYLLDKTNNNSPKITVADGTFDNTSTSLTLVGRAFLGWGEPFNENFLALLENFNDDKPPRSPITGQLWYDSKSGKMRFYDGAVFNVLTVLPASSEGYLYDNGSGVTQWISASQLSNNLNRSLFPTVDSSSPTYNKTGYLVKNPDGSYSWVSGDTLINNILPANNTTNPGGGVGTGVLTKNPDGSYTWVNLNTFVRKTDLTEASKYLVPVGAIIMWSGTIATIPVGWVLCDGKNNTPNLLDKFVMGAGDAASNIYGVGETGGSADAVVVSHNHASTPTAHRHTFAGDDQISYAKGAIWDGTKVGSFEYDAKSTLGGNGAIFTTSEATAGVTLSSTGVDGTDKNLPPYYALAFIMKIKN